MSEMWDSVAPAWERHADAVDAHVAAGTAALLDAAQIGAGDTVLDIAAGAGGAGLAAAARTGPTGRVVLADDAPGMVAAAARRSAGLPHVSTLLSDLARIDAPDASFDAAICRHGLMFALTPADAVREAGRVLRPGGWYAAMTWDARAANPWLGLIMDAVGAQFGAPFPPPGILGPFSIDGPDLLAGALAAGGLEDVHVVRIATPLRGESLEAWWDLVPQFAGPLAVALEGMDAEVVAEIRSRALELGAQAARPAGAGIELDGSVLVGSGRRPAG